MILVDLDGAAGAMLAPMPPAEPPASMRFGYPGKLATSVRGRLKRLAGGANPAELQLGHDVSVEQWVALLSHLDAHWYQSARSAAAASSHDSISCRRRAWPRTSASAAGRSTARIRSAGCTYQGAQHLRRWAR